MSVVVIASYLAAFLLNASQVLKASEGMLGVLPEKIRWVPGFILSCIPPIAGYLGAVKTNLDFVTALALSGGIIVQGLMATQHAKTAKEARALKTANAALQAKFEVKQA